MKSAAIIGCGKATGGMEGFAIGHAHAHGYRQAFPDLALCGVDINPDNLAAFGTRFNVPKERLFNSTTALYAALTPDAVSICTWPTLHRPQVVEAAQRGVQAVTCEKPMALDGSEMDDMLAACRKHKVRLAIAHQRRYTGVFQQARQLLAAGALGDKLVLHGRVGGGWDLLSWTVHWFDMAAYLLDDQPISVLAGVDHTGKRRYQHAVEDASVVFMEFTRGSQAVFVTGPAALPYDTGIHITGSAGMLRFVGSSIEVLTGAGAVRHAVTPLEYEGFAGLFRDLWQGVLDPQHDVLCGVEHSGQATRLAFAAHESARTQRRISLPARDLGYAPLELLQHPAQRTTRLGRVALLADPHHADPASGEGGREGLRDALLALGATAVKVVPVEQREPTAADLAEADLLVIYHTQVKSSPAGRELLGAWIGGGKPTVVAHCGIGAYADWPQYRQWIGRYWVWGGEPLPASGHPHVPCELQVVPNSGFAPGFDPGYDTAWLPRDEVYIRLGQCAPVRDFVTARIPEGEAPIAWQAENVPNVAVWAPGHRREIWGLEVMRQGLLATIKRVLPR